MLVILVCGAGGIAGQTASDGECMGVSGGSHEEIIHELLGRVVGVKSQELARSRLGYRMVHGEGYGGVACATGKGDRRYFPAGQGATHDGF